MGIFILNAHFQKHVHTSVGSHSTRSLSRVFLGPNQRTSRDGSLRFFVCVVNLNNNTSLNWVSKGTFVFNMTEKEWKEYLETECKDFCIKEKESFDSPDNPAEDAYIPSLSIYKEEKLIAIVDFLYSNEKEKELLRTMWRFCNHAFLFIIVKKDCIIVYERPAYHFIAPKPVFDFRFIFSFDDFMKNKAIKYNEKEELTNFLNSYERIRSIPMESFLKKLTEIQGKYNLTKEIKFFSDTLKRQDAVDILEFDDKECWLHRNYENLLMRSILGSETGVAKLCRYSSIDTLRKMLSEGTVAMCSIVTMNDTSEVDYARKYLEGSNIDIREPCSSHSNVINTYIMSLCKEKLEDDLTMWRLYGDNAKGVCVQYEVEKLVDDTFFWFADVSYAETRKQHTKLDFIKSLMQLEFEHRRFRLKNWNVWQHFFKPYDYSIEQEVRLLLFIDDLIPLPEGIKKEWITTSDGITAPLITIPINESSSKESFPLKVIGVNLGPKFPEKETIKKTLLELAKKSEGAFPSFTVNESVINNYR